jgi:hypothetical protein
MTRKISIVTLVLAVVLLVAALVPGLARATFPGGSGAVAYVTGNGASAQVCVQHLDGSPPRCVNAPWADEVALQPLSGRWLIVLVPIGGSNALYAVDTEAEPLSTPTLMGPTGLTPSNVTWLDASTIAYAAGGDIWTAQVQNGQLVGAPVNRTNTASATESDPTWLPNYRIGYVRDGDLWTMGTQGQSQTCVREAPGSRTCYQTAAEESDLNFSLAGLYYTADGNIYRLKLNKHGELTQPPVSVVATRADERSPAPSPGGKELVFERAGEVVHMQTETLDEKALVAGHAPDWGSVFKILTLPDDEEQEPYDVEVEEHGTFAIIDFKTPQPEEHATAVLQDVLTGELEWEEATSDPATTEWSIVVDDLDPGTPHTLAIYAGDQGYSSTEKVTTLERNVTIAFQEAGGIEDDGDPGTCGDFLFAFQATAGSQVAWNSSGEEEIPICDDEEPYTWNPSPDILVELANVKVDSISLYILAVDDDADICPACIDPWPAPPWTGYKDLGDWAEEETPHNVGLDSNGDEEWTHGFTLEVQQGDGNPHLKWWYTITVSYS